MADRQRIVVALGGNAISQPHEEGTVAQQFANSRSTAKVLVDLIERGNQIMVTHGNGPQIGNFLLRNELGRGHIYPLSMEVAVAHVQGGMGFMIAQTLMNELRSRGNEQVVTTVITTVLVDRDDPSFANPTKPVGRTLTREEADGYAREEGWTMKEIQPGRFRRVVPSPQPKHIMEIEHIRRAFTAGEVLVVCGGGGVPVIRDQAGDLHGTRAVIDKDLASALLADEIGADAMLILTAVDRVCINFGKPDERSLERMTAAEARQYLAQGQFPPGSMGPKIQGAINFLNTSDNPAARVIIGPLDKPAEAVAGTVGTTIVK